MRRPGTFTSVLSMLAALIIVPAIGNPSLAGAGEEAAVSVADEFMVLSGLDRHIEQLPRLYAMFVDQVFLGIERSGARVPGRTKNLVRRRFQEAIDVQAAQLAARRRVAGELSGNLVTPTMDWLRSDLGRKITELENQAASPDSSLQQAAFALQLQMEPPPPERMQLARRLEEATEMSDYAVTEWKTVVEALAITLNPDRTGSIPGGRDAVRDNLEKMRPDMKNLLRQTTLRHILFAYHSLTDEEFTEYVAFLESRTGHDVNKLVRAVLKEIEESALERMQAHVTDSVATHRRKDGV